MHRPFKGNCERCGQEYIVERGGYFDDRAYYELFHEHMDLQAQLKSARRWMLRYFLMLVRAGRNGVK